MLQRFNLLSIPLKISLSFLVTVLCGSILLSLPISQLDSSQATFFDHLFTAISMVCVTGLYTQPVYLTYNLFGKLIGMGLMSIGGLGILTFIAYLYYVMTQRLNFSEQVTLTEALNREKLGDFKPFIRSIFKFVLIFEVLGALGLMTYFVPELGWRQGAFTSVFLSISAFNNAGFDNLGAASLIPYASVPAINIVIPLLIIFGGLGFSVWMDLNKHIKDTSSWKDFFNIHRLFHHLSLHSKVVLKVTSVLLLAGAIFFFVLEYNHAMVDLSLIDKIQMSIFQSVTMRTAGFSTVGFRSIHTATLLICSIFMFIGGSPGGTAGGAKTTTIAIAAKLLIAEARGHNDVIFYHRMIPKKIIQKALIISATFIAIIIVNVIVISYIEQHITLDFIIFEVISALATVGVTADLTPELSRYSQSLIMLLMFIGRIGPITIFTALKVKQNRHPVQRAEGHIIIG